MSPRLVARRGAVSLTVLLALPVLLLLLGLTIYFALVRESKGEVQNGADAAALAAAQALACDDLLLANLDRHAGRLNRARDAAVAVAAANRSQSQSLALDRNPENEPDGDIVFGAVARPLDPFYALGTKGGPADAAAVTAVRVTPGRGPVRAPLGGPTNPRDMRARATAFLDWRVTGFAPKGEKPAPLMPLAICFGRKGVPEGEWEPEWRKGAADNWRFDTASGTFKEGGDGIPEYAVVLGGDPGAGEHACLFVQFGTEDPDALLRQICGGVTREDLAKWGGELSLGVHNTVTASGSSECPPVRHPLRTALEQALLADRSPRAWPLFALANPETGAVNISGWTGARVAAVEHTTDGRVLLWLQPAVVCHPSVVTGAGRAPAFWNGNRTVCAVRLAE